MRIFAQNFKTVLFMRVINGDTIRKYWEKYFHRVGYYNVRFM